MESSELRERVFEANRAIVDADLVVLTFGNASAVDRAAGVMAIKPSGVPYEELDPASMVVVDLESGEAREGDARPSSDTPTHLVLYRAFEQEEEPTDLTIGEVLVDFVPLSKLMGESMTSLRTWAKGRARPATTPCSAMRSDARPSATSRRSRASSCS